MIAEKIEAATIYMKLTGLIVYAMIWLALWFA
jgi:hypothetical protein